MDGLSRWVGAIAIIPFVWVWSRLNSQNQEIVEMRKDIKEVLKEITELRVEQARWQEQIKSVQGKY